MANELKIKRGAEVNLQLLNQSEFAFTTDSYKLFIGTGSENLLVNTPYLESVNAFDISNVESKLTDGTSIITSFAHTHPEYLLTEDKRIPNWDESYNWGNWNGGMTSSYIPYFNGTNLISSTIFQNGSNVTIGATDGHPVAQFSISDGGTSKWDYFAQYGYTQLSNTVTGHSWLYGIVNSSYNGITDDFTFKFNNGTSWVQNLFLQAGNVFIGYTADPTSGNKLAVNGNGYFAGNVIATDTITALGGNSTNWNTAYGWGNWNNTNVMRKSPAANTDYWNEGDLYSVTWNNVLPDGLSGIYNYGLSLQFNNNVGEANIQFYAPEESTGGITGDMWYRTGWGTTKRSWAKLYSSLNSNISTVNWAANNITATGASTASNFISNVATGTQPYATTSTTLNTNLNADLWDGKQFATYLNQPILATSSPTFAGLTISNLSFGGTNLITETNGVFYYETKAQLALDLGFPLTTLLTDSYIPYYHAATNEFWNSTISTDGTNISISGTMTLPADVNINLGVNAGYINWNNIGAYVVIGILGTDYFKFYDDGTSDFASDLNVGGNVFSPGFIEGGKYLSAKYAPLTQGVPADYVSAITTGTSMRGELNIVNVATGVTITVSDILAIGDRIDFLQKGVGQLTFIGASGITLLTPKSLVTRTQNSMVSIVKVATSTWVITGDLQ